MTVRISSGMRSNIRALVHDLVRGRFNDLQADGRAGRLTAEELQRALLEYGRTLIDLPDEAWSLSSVYSISDTEVSIEVPLWTMEEGRSDLTLSVTVNTGDGEERVSIDDLHVL